MYFFNYILILYYTDITVTAGRSRDRGTVIILKPNLITG